jgi:predicted outer membrane lipoprotein
LLISAQGCFNPGELVFQTVLNSERVGELRCLANAFSVVTSLVLCDPGLSRCSNPGLQLANAFGVLSPFALPFRNKAVRHFEAMPFGVLSPFASPFRSNAHRRFEPFGVFKLTLFFRAGACGP